MKLDERGMPEGYELSQLEIAPREVRDKLAGKLDFDLIDCRRPDEWELTHIDGARLIPLQQLAAKFESELAGKESREIVVYCKMGGRSLQFVQMLKQAGFTNVRSMAGGIILWNTDINPAGPKY
jgi:sulfur-carrier protein adenylyltransferase/sulfurtransferase